MLRFSPIRRVNSNQPASWRRFGRLSRSVALPLMLLCSAFVGTAVAHASEEPKAACSAATETTAECLSIIVPEGAFPSYQGSGEKGGFAPKDLRSAYNLPSTGGSGQTIAIVDAFDDPNAESDLKTYRSHYGLSECTTANGCFKKVNQKGETKNYPVGESGWSVEISLDLDMASAICPECHILLVEGTSNSFANLATAEDEAATLNATEISNSWGGGDTSARVSEDSHFNHLGIPILVAAGDNGYGVEFPATVPTVISVGGTTLKKAETSRGWSEKVWHEPELGYGTGSGCSLYQEKPKWQTDSGCTKRTDNDVSAVAAVETPLSVYDSYERAGWLNIGGTSASTPIMAGVEALSSSRVREIGAEAFWKASPAGHLFDVTEGSNGSCGESYLCTAKKGYDGPTGWGTPDGVIKVAEPPSVTTEAATSVTDGAATLHAKVNPNESDTHYQFEYGLTTSYGTKVPVPSEDVGSGHEALAKSQTLTELQPETIYHFRAVASNSEGTTNGSEGTFTTSHVTWTPEEPPHPKEASGSYLNGVSCTSSAACIAVGYFVNGLGKHVPLAESWNGTSWTAQEPPAPKEAKESDLNGVSCTSSTACTAAGYFKNSAGTIVPLIEKLKESVWSTQEPSIPTGAKEGVLHGVSCISSSECMATGYFENSSGKRVPLAEGWESSKWVAEEPPLPKESKGEGTLGDVSCAGTFSYCGASDYFVNSSGTTAALGENWVTGSWIAEEVPGPKEAKESVLPGVSCNSSERCSAAGYFKNGAGVIVPWAFSVNGKAETVEEPPVPSEVKASGFYGMSCTPFTACAAVGHSEASSGAYTQLAERWNSTAWSLQEVPSPKGTLASDLEGVSCPSPVVCIAVGAFYGSGGTVVPLVESSH